MKTRSINMMLAASILSLVSFSALAADEKKDSSSETKAKMQDVKPSKLEQQQDTDEIITNKKLRAETGSKSKYSISAGLGYNGGSIEKPGDRIRPNIRGAAGTTALASLAGSIEGKYRMSSQSSIGVGGSFRVLTPFQDDITKDKVKRGDRSIQRSNVQDPYVSYTYLYRGPMDTQAVTSVGANATTTDFDRNVLGQMGSASVSQTMIKDLGPSGLSLGLALELSYSMFDKFTPEAKADSSDYFVGVYPFLEYGLNDTFNLRTVTGLWQYEHVRSEDAMTFNRNQIYQSFGLGISVTRDIFLYPNVQFLPEDIRADRTNVALSANINVF